METQLQFKMLRPTDFNSETNKQVKVLFDQLNNSIKQMDADKIVDDESNIVVVCHHINEIIGMATMATYQVISGHKGMIEDVVVSQEHRGKGIGKKMMQLLLERANELQLDEILLFSGHHRHAAISLYKSLGFQLKDSGLYRLQL